MNRAKPNLRMLLKLLPIVASIVAVVDCSDVELSRGDYQQVDSSLNLTGNGFKNMPDRWIKKKFLTKLILDKNQIPVVSSESFSFLPKLTHLSLANNLLTSLDLKPFSKLANLKMLILNGNCKSQIDSSYLSRYKKPHKYSYDSSNHSTSRYDDDHRLCRLRVDTVISSLTHLYLENNTIQQLSVVDSGKLPSLTHLHLSHNPHIMDLIDIFDVRKLAPSLTHLYLNYCNITRFDPSQPSTVTALYLDGNHIDTIHNEHCYSSGLNLRWSSQLEILSVSHNRIRRLNETTFGMTVNLVSLDLSHNEISSIENRIFDKLPLLKYLNLKNNEIRNLDRGAFKYTTNLISLDLSYNRISRIGIEIFDKLQRLEYLNLENNFVMRSLFTSKLQLCTLFTNLKSLSLGNNSIENIHAVDFKNMLKLKVLSLNNNRISHIEPKTFANLSELEELSLAGNSLDGINDILPTSGSLITLNLDGNHIRDTRDVSLVNVSNLAFLSLKNNPVHYINIRWLADVPENLSVALGISRSRINEVHFRKSSFQTMN